MTIPLISVRRLPVTVGLVTAISLATVWSSELSEAQRQRLMLLSSTNLHGLAAHPLTVLLTSVLWSTPGGLLTFVAPAAVILGVIEWRIGPWRTLTVVAAGHVGGTLLSASGIASGISLGTLPVAAAGAVDVGASYAVMAAVGFAIVLVVGHARVVLGVALLGWLAAGVVLDRDFTAFGHLFAALIGFALAVGGLGIPRPSRPRIATAIVVALMAVAPLTGYVDLYTAEGATIARPSPATGRGHTNHATRDRELSHRQATGVRHAVSARSGMNASVSD